MKRSGLRIYYPNRQNTLALGKSLSRYGIQSTKTQVLEEKILLLFDVCTYLPAHRAANTQAHRISHFQPVLKHRPCSNVIHSSLIPAFNSVADVHLSLQAAVTCPTTAASSARSSLVSPGSRVVLKRSSLHQL